MPGNETITLRLVAQDLMSGNVSKAISGLDTLAKRGGLVGSVMQGVGQSFGQMLNPIGLVTSAIGTATDYLNDAWRAASEEEAAISKLTTAIRENDAAWDGNIDAIEAVIQKRQTLAFADSEQRESISRLVSVTKDYSQALDLSRQAMDLARLRNMSLVDASELLGKVYGGNLGILSRYGIQLRKGATVTEALAEINRRAAGQAEAFAETTAGAMAQLDIALGDLQENIGKHLLPVIKELASNILDMMGVANRNDAGLKAWSEDLVALAGSGQQGVDMIASMRDGVQSLNDILQPQVDEAADFAKSYKDIAEAAGIGERAIMDAFLRAKDGAGLGAEGAKAAVREMIASYLFAETELGKYADLIKRSLWGVGRAAEGSSEQTQEALAAIRRAHGRTARMMLSSVKSVMEPYKREWREMARAAKNPFRPSAFEDWIADRHKAAIRKSQDPDLPAKTRRYWTRVARAMSSPIFDELAMMMGSLREAALAINAVNRAGRLINTGIGDWIDGWSWGGGGGGGGGRGGGGGGGGGGGSPHSPDHGFNLAPVGGPAVVQFHFHGLAVAPSEADTDRMARQLDPVVRRVLMGGMA